MSTRRSFLAHCAMFFSALAAASTFTSRAALAADPAPPPPLGSGLASLTYKQQLEKGLKARRPSDFTFIDTVITKIEAGEITQKMVNETFDYARQKSTHYPFIYFQFAIRKRAEKLGVSL